ncbi:hypothetical protein EC919_108103 [Pseudomonas graminis]|nr:hypothetical protein EC919_108103 [Pseudomonas graminis]
MILGYFRQVDRSQRWGIVRLHGEVDKRKHDTVMADMLGTFEVHDLSLAQQYCLLPILSHPPVTLPAALPSFLFCRV